MEYECFQNQVAELHQGTKAEQRAYFKGMIERHKPQIERGPGNNCTFRFTCDAVEIGCAYRYKVVAFGDNILKTEEVEVISCKGD